MYKSNSKAAASKGAEDAAQAKFDSLKVARQKSIPELKNFRKGNEAFQGEEGFREEIAFFIRSEFYYPSALTIGDIVCADESSSDIKCSIATLLRIASQPMCGFPSGHISDGPHADSTFPDTLCANNDKQIRVKTRIFLQWMLKDPFDCAGGKDVVRSDNVVGILVRVLSCDPLYRFSDALDITLRENVMVHERWRHSIALQRKDICAKRLKDINEAAQDCDNIFDPRELLIMTMHPWWFREDMQKDIAGIEADRYKALLDDIIRARRQANGGKEMDNVAYERAKKDATNGAKKDKSPEAKLIKEIGMNRDDCSSQVATMRNLLVATESEYVGSDLALDDTDDDIYRQLSTRHIETRCTSYGGYVYWPLLHFGEYNGAEVKKLAALAEKMDSMRHTSIQDLPNELNPVKVFTLKNALRKAHEAGACEDQCRIEKYYDSRFDAFDPDLYLGDLARLNRSPVGTFRSKEWPHFLRPGTTTADLAQEEELNEITAAPWRAKHYREGNFSVFVRMSEARLSILETFRFPWVETDFPRRLETAFKDALMPSDDTKRRIDIMLGELKRYSDNSTRRNSISVPNTTATISDDDDDDDDDSDSDDNAEDFRSRTARELNCHSVYADAHELAIGALNSSELGDVYNKHAAFVNSASVTIEQCIDTHSANKKEFSGHYSATRGAGVKAVFESPYQRMQKTHIIKHNTHHLADSLQQMHIKLCVLQQIAFDEFKKLWPDFRNHCLMEFSRVYRACAKNNGASLNGIYAWQQCNSTNFFGLKMVSKQLSIFGNAMASAAYSATSEMGILQEVAQVVQQLATRSNAFDMEAVPINRLVIGPTSCGKTHNQQTINECSIQCTRARVDISTSQADNDLSVEGYQIRFTEEAPVTVTHPVNKERPDQIKEYNDLRNKLDGGKVAKSRSNKGLHTEHIEIDARRVFEFTGNSLEPDWNEPSMVYRFYSNVYRCTTRRKGHYESLMYMQMIDRTANKERRITTNASYTMWQHQQMWTSLSLHMSSCFAAPQPCVFLLSAAIPTIMNHIGGMLPRAHQYVRHAGREYAIARCLAAHRAWYVTSCTPLAHHSNATGDMSPNNRFDVTHIKDAAPHAIVTMEMVAWCALDLIEQINPWHMHVTMHAFAVKFGGWSPHSMDHLFESGGRGFGHPIYTDASSFSFGHMGTFTRPPSLFKIAAGEGPHKLLTYGTEPKDFGRGSLEEMPEFWRHEEYNEETVGKRHNPRYYSKSIEEISYSGTPGIIDPNYVVVDYGIRQRPEDAIYSVLEESYTLEQEWIKHAVSFLRSKRNNMLKLPQLRSIQTKKAKLEWRMDGGNVLVSEVPILIQNSTSHELKINTVWLWMARHRFLRMNLLHLLEDSHTKDGEKWVLPLNVPDEAGILQVFSRLNQPTGVSLKLYNPAYSGASTSNGTSTSNASDWIANIQKASLAEHLKKNSLCRSMNAYNDVLTNVCAQQLAAQDASREIRKTASSIRTEHTAIDSDIVRQCLGCSSILKTNETERFIVMETLPPDDDCFVYFWLKEGTLPPEKIITLLPSACELRVRRDLAVLAELEATVTKADSVYHETPLSAYANALKNRLGSDQPTSPDAAAAVHMPTNKIMTCDYPSSLRSVTQEYFVARVVEEKSDESSKNTPDVQVSAPVQSQCPGGAVAATTETTNNKKRALDSTPSPYVQEEEKETPLQHCAKRQASIACIDTVDPDPYRIDSEKY